MPRARDAHTTTIIMEIFRVIFGKPYLNSVWRWSTLARRQWIEWQITWWVTLSRRLLHVFNRVALRQTSQFSHSHIKSRTQVQEPDEIERRNWFLMKTKQEAHSQQYVIELLSGKKGSDRDISKLVPEIIRALKMNKKRRQTKKFKRRNPEDFHIYKLVISNAARVVPPGFDTSLALSFARTRFQSVWSIEPPSPSEGT